MRNEGDRDDELPDELADRAGLQLMAATGADRAAVLAALIAAHPQHAAALRRLQADLDCVESVLASSYQERAGDDAFAAPTDVGGHRVIRRLGEGAFGTVYLCAQERPVTRQVAIKVLRSGAGGPETLRRFATERQLLAALNHAAITQVFDAGELADGRPFFVMEYVDGAPIGSYCDTHGLDARDRLRLFGEVCRGVAHAHARGIVHRDLKPANVLVVTTDNGPAPKIIDFGIAKALFATRDAGGSGGPATEAGRVVGTPGYMSPEQASGRVDEVDGRADVFSLGVILYELLTGELPWAKGAAATDAEPLRPSQRVVTSNIAPARSVPVPRQKLASELRGDLDWITMKALARDRADRYASVAQLAADVAGHLRGDTVSVGPPSWRYRLRKFARRNRVAVVTAIGAVVAIGVIGGAFYLHAADADAVAAKAIAQATSAVERLLARASDDKLRQVAANDTVRQALAQDALGFYEVWLHERPTERRLRQGRCRALVSLSSVHWQLGQLPAAERTATEAVAEAQALFDEAPDDLATHALLAEALRRHGRALMATRHEVDALRVLSNAVDHLEQCHRNAPADHAMSLSSGLRELASAREANRQIDSSIEAGRRSVTVLEERIAAGAVPPQMHTDVTLARETVARQFLGAGKPDAAEACLAAAEAGLAAVTIDVHRVTARVHDLRAASARRRRDWPAAIAQATLAVAAGERWRQQEPARMVPGDVLISDLSTLAELQERVADWATADATLRRAIAVADEMVAAFPTDDSRLARLEGQLHEAAFRLYERLRLPDLELAQTWMQRALDIQASVLARGGRPHRARGQSLTMMALIREARGEGTSASWEEAAAEMTVDIDVTTPKHEFDFAAWFGAATSRLRDGRLEEASVALAQAARWNGDPPKHADQACDVEWLRARIALQRGEVEGAVTAAKRILEVRPTWMGRWRAADCYLGVHRRLLTLPDRDPASAIEPRDEAARLYRLVIDGLAKDVAGNADDPWFVVPWSFASVQLAQIEMARDRPDEAGKWLDPGLAGLARVANLAHRDLWQPEVVERGKILQATLRERDRR